MKIHISIVTEKWSLNYNKLRDHSWANMYSILLNMSVMFHKWKKLLLISSALYILTPQTAAWAL